MASTRRVAALTARQNTTALDEAQSAWDAGQYERVLSVLDDARLVRREDTAAATLLRARALLALDRPEDVEPLLRRASKELKGADETTLSQMLLGAALTRTDKREKGEALLDEAATLAKRGAPNLVPEIAYYRALSRWSAFRLPEAEEIVEAALPGATDVVRSRLLQLLGWIDVRRENYGAAAHEFTAALDALDKAKVPDMNGRARILIALATIATETIDLRLGRQIRREYETFAWTDERRVERFQILECLSWLSLLEGETPRAWDERQVALTLTGDATYHARALIDAANIAGIVGDRFSESRYMELAGTLLLRGDQVALDVDRRLTMLAFIAAVPAADTGTAERVYALYDRTRPRRTTMLAFEGDRRLEAYELFAQGKLALGTGKVQQGVAQLEQSLELWTRLSHRLRVALVANALRAATGERRYAQIALDALRNAPNAWLRGPLERRSTEENPLEQLTPAERRVLGELCKGRKAREIADTFERSFNTINNHTRAIFSAFGVRSRAALVAECARLGILDEIKIHR